MGEPDSFWPEHVPNEVTVEAFVQLFAAEGFMPCESGSLEAGFGKIALYVRDGVPRHAARQHADGSWTSKLGTWIDLDHASLAALEGGTYGEVTIFLRRPQ